MFSNLIMICNKTVVYLVLQATYFIHHGTKLRNRRMINRLLYFQIPKLIPFTTMQKAKLFAIFLDFPSTKQRLQLVDSWSRGLD